MARRAVPRPNEMPTPRQKKSVPTRKGDATRQRILEAAIDEFSAKGFAGARVDAICRAASSNPRMLYLYFGDKDGLYVAVLDEVLGRLRQEELTLDIEHVRPLEGLLQLFDFVHGHFGRHPELINLLSGENLLGARFLSRSEKTPTVSSPLIALVERLLARGEREGIFRQKIDALQLYVMIVALSYYHRSNAHTLTAIFRTDIRDTEWLEVQRRYAREMITLFVHKR